MILKDANNRTGLEKKFFELCGQIIQDLDLTLYDLEYFSSRKLLRLYIFNKKTGTALLDDCVKVDHAMGPLMEEEWVPEEIVLEVSSPGLYRHLSTLDHFSWAVGQIVSLVLFGQISPAGLEAIPGPLKKQRKFRGVLEKAEDEKITLKVDNDSFGIYYADIKKAQLDPDIKLE